MLLAEEFALIALDPDSGRHALRVRRTVNACLAGLLIAELRLDGPRPAAPILVAASEVVVDQFEDGSALSAMSRHLRGRLGVATWGAVVGGLVDAHVVAPASGRVRSRHRVLDHAARDAIVGRLQVAAAVAEQPDVRTAALLSMVAEAHMLKLVGSGRASRKDACRRSKRALVGTGVQRIVDAVHKELTTWKGGGA